MADYRTFRPCAVPGSRLLTLARRHFEAIGYRVTDTGTNSITLKLIDGTYWTTSVLKIHQKVKIESAGMVVRFKFLFPMGSSLGSKDRRALDELIEEFMATLDLPIPAEHIQHVIHEHRSGPSQHTVERQVVVTRCKYCQHLTPVDLAVCENCGAPKFC